MASNDGQRQRWNDAYWTSIWPRREELTAQVTPLLVDRLAPAAGERVLEVGCGGGTATFPLAERVGAGQVVAVDLSAPLVALAQERAATRPAGNVRFLVADAQEEAVPGAPFDAVVSQFGVMFFDEPVKAFAGLRAHTRPGGRLVFACWRDASHNLWNTGRVMARFVPPPAGAAGETPAGPFSLADPAVTRELLAAAGWEGVELDAHDLVVPVQREAVFEEGELRWRGVADGDVDAARAAVDEQLDLLARPDGRLDAPLALWVVAATAPGAD